MKKKFLKRFFVAATLILVATSLRSQKAPAFDWVKTIGSSYHEAGKDIALDGSGNVLTAGYFTGSVDFDPGSNTYSLSSFSGTEDIYISKLTSAGNFVWARRIGGNKSDQGLSIVADSTGYVYVTGYFRDTVDFDPGSGVFNLISSGKEDIFILKLDPSGNLVWATGIGGSNTDMARAIDIDISGNIYTTGEYSGTVDFDSGTSTYTLGNGGVFVCKVNGNGNFIWANGTGLSTGNAIEVDGSGNVYTTGNFYGSYGLDFDPGSGTYTVQSFGYTDVYVRKLDASGNFLWAASWGGISYDNGNGIAVDKAGNVYTTGYFRVTADFDPGAGTYTLNSGQSTCEDVFISKLDAAGNFLWAKQMGGSLTDLGVGIALDTAGNVYSIGTFMGVADFDPAYSQYILSESSWSTPDVFFSKLDASGNFIWAKSFGGWSTDDGSGIAVNAAGEIFSTGYFQGTVDFDPYLGVQTHTSAGVYDAFIHKFVPCNVPSMAVNVTSAALQTICVGKSTTLSATGSGTISWGPVGFALATGTNYIVSANSVGPGVHYFYATANTCVNSQSTTLITVTVFPNPVISVSSGSICNGQTFSLSPSGAQSYTIEGGNAIVSPTSNATYTVIGTSSAGCIAPSVATASVTVHTPPVISVFSGTTCSGQPFMLSPSGAVSYTYQGGSAIITPTVSGVYTVTGSSSEGCISLSAGVASVTVYPRPVISVNSGSICSGKNFTFSPSGGATYTIQGGNFIVSPAVTTTYNVIGTSSLGCIANAAIVATVAVAVTPTVYAQNGSVCSGNNYSIFPGGAFTYTFSGGGPVVTPSVTTSYFISGTSISGCVSAKITTVTITVNPLPTITVNSGSICPGKSFTIIPSGATTYSFQGGSAIVSPVSSNNYTVTGSSSQGCKASSPATVGVYVYPGATVSVNSGSICFGQAFTLQPTGAVNYIFESGNAVVSPTANAQYTISGTGIGGCAAKNTATAIVLVMPSPTVTVNSGSICQGQSFTIQPSGANSYTVQGGNLVVAPNISTQYTISGSGVNGCISNPAVSSQVMVHPRPQLIISVSNYSVCVNQSSQLSAGGAQSYTWIPLVPPGGIVSPGSTTTYSVTGSDANNCVSLQESVTIFVQDCTSLSEEPSVNENSFSIYPNPATDHLTINSSASGRLFISNALGQIVHEQLLESSITEINLTQFAEGLYFITLGANTQRMVRVGF